jgi:hypothetical protein
MAPSKRTYTTLVVLAAAAFFLINLSGVSQYKNATHGLDWVIGGIGWFGGLACCLAFLVLGARTIVIARRRRRAGKTAAA